MDHTSFILNDREITTSAPAGMPVLDFIRRTQRLTGTKIGCREGDCGACTVLVGTREGAGGMHYASMTSCLMPLANAAGKHLVTVEGLNRDMLTPVQRAIVDEGGTQCGFCTVGFVVSLAGFCLSRHPATQAEAVAAMDGNICRCTGYKSLERAAARICSGLADKPKTRPIAWLVEAGFLPAYFADIPERLARLHHAAPQPAALPAEAVLMGGGTDLYVQRPDALRDAAVRPLAAGAPGRIREEAGEIVLDAHVTVEDVKRDPLMQALIPDLEAMTDLVSSTPIRNMATLAGNFVNASPIGDMTVFFLALDARLDIAGPTGTRRVALSAFFQGYKIRDIREGEHLTAVRFTKPGEGFHFHFEKVSKRRNLDIASVNSAAGIVVQDDRIVSAHLSAGGVAPIPLYLRSTSAWLVGRPVTPDTVREASALALNEIAPISDARGTAAYKRLLLRQLIYAHFLTRFPQAVHAEALV